MELNSTQFVVDLFVVYFAGLLPCSNALAFPSSADFLSTAYSYFVSEYSLLGLPTMGTCSGTEGAAVMGCGLLTSYLFLFIVSYDSVSIPQRIRKSNCDRWLPRLFTKRRTTPPRARRVRKASREKERHRPVLLNSRRRSRAISQPPSQTLHRSLHPLTFYKKYTLHTTTTKHDFEPIYVVSPTLLLIFRILSTPSLVFRQTYC